MELAEKPVPFADTQNVPFIPRPEVINTAKNLEMMRRNNSSKMAVLALLSGPGTGKSRLLDELSEMAAQCDDENARKYLTAVEKSHRINVTFNSGNGEPSMIEDSLGVGVTMALRVLHACFRRSQLDTFRESPIMALVYKWNKPDLISTMTVTNVIKKLFPDKSVTILIDEFHVLGGSKEEYEARMSDCAKLLASLVKNSEDGPSLQVVLAGVDIDPIEKAFEKSNSVHLHTVSLAPFSAEQVVQYTDKFLFHNGPKLHPQWRSNSLIRTSLSVLGTIPRILECGLSEICQAPQTTSNVWDFLFFENKSYVRHALHDEFEPVIMHALSRTPLPTGLQAQYESTGELIPGQNGLPTIASLALYHWSNVKQSCLATDVRTMLRLSTKKDLTGEDFGLLCSLATSVRLNSSRTLSKAGYPLWRLLALEKYQCQRDVADLLVELPDYIPIIESPTAFGMADDRKQFLNCITLNFDKTKSADSCLRLRVQGSDEWDYVTLAYQDKYYFSRAPPMKDEPAKVFVENCHHPKDKLIMVVRSPFPTQGNVPVTGQTVVFLEGPLFLGMFFDLLAPLASLCINAATAKELQRHLDVGEVSARFLHKSIQAQNVTALEQLPRPRKYSVRRWREKLVEMKSLLDLGLIYF